MKKCPNCDYRGSFLVVGECYGYQCPGCGQYLSKNEMYGSRKK